MIHKIAAMFLLVTIFIPIVVMARGGDASKIYGGVYGPLGPNAFQFRTGITISNLSSKIDTIANYLLGLLIAVSVFFVLYAAYLYLSSGGGEKETTSARNYLIYAAVAIAVGLFAKAIPGIVDSILP